MWAMAAGVMSLNHCPSAPLLLLRPRVWCSTMGSLHVWRDRVAAFPGWLRGGPVFDGGIHLPDMKAASLTERIRPVVPRATLSVPLGEGGRDDASVSVSPGDAVLAGRRIATNSADATGVHAPVSGRVRGLTEAKLPDLRIVKAVEIEPDRDGISGPAAEASSVDAPPPEAVLELLAEAGVVDRYSRLPVAERLAQARDRGIRTLIVSGMESQPYLSAEIAVMREHPREVVAGASHLARAIGATETILAADEAYAAPLARVRGLARKAKIRWAPLMGRYPQSLPVLLIKSLLQIETPPGADPHAVGVAVFDVATAWAVAEALDRRRPHVATCLTVSGEAIARPGNYLAPVGLPIADLLDAAGVADDTRRVIVGGPLMGRAISDLRTVVTKWTTGVLAMRTVPRYDPVPCVRCGWCVEDCPVGVDPSELLSVAETRQYARAAALHPEACIDCGLCTYECPSRLPLAESVRELKAHLAQ